MPQNDEKMSRILKDAIESSPIDEDRKKKGLENILESLNHPERAKQAEAKFGDLMEKTEAPEAQLGEWV